MRNKLPRWIPQNSETFEHPEGLGVCYLYPADHIHATPGVVCYGGKRANHDHHYSFKTREKAIAYINEYFANLTASAKYQADRRAERKARVPDPSNPTLAETAQLVREALAQAFSKTKFSVRSESYSMGCSIHVNWTDGPTSSQVDRVLSAFERCGFDGMQDLKTYNGPSIYKGRVVNFGADYVQGSRSLSIDALKAAAMRVAFECDLPLLKISDAGSVESGGYHVDYRYFHQGDEAGICHDSHQGSYYDQLIYQVAHNTSLEAMQPVDLPVLKPCDEEPEEPPSRITDPVDDGSCDPIADQRMDAADLQAIRTRFLN